MKGVKTFSRFIGGIAEFNREGTVPDSYAFGQAIDVRSNPQNITLLSRSIKVSSTVIQALPKWGEYVIGTNPLGTDSYVFFYDEAGNIYQNNLDVYTLLHTVPNSHGNGMSWFGEDNFLYYTSDKLIGRYGPVGSSSATFVDDFFGSQGGTPLNTASIDFESGSTQYASRADTASLSITGDLSLECWIKPESLPTVGNTTTLISKWTENGNLRSYKFGIGTVSNYFGNGSDGPLTIAVNTTEAPIDSACTGASGAYALSATNASFATGQQILIHQSQGTGAGNWMKNEIQSYTAGTITTVLPLNATYSAGAQVRVLPQYTDVTINNGVTYLAKAWNGTTGGILAFLASGTITINGAISAGGRGYRAGAAVSSTNNGNQGEGTAGTGSASNSPNGNGGGGGRASAVGSAGGAGGGNGAIGSNASGAGLALGAGYDSTGGNTSGSSDLTTMTFGGGGASGGAGQAGGSGSGTSGVGGIGGGIVFLSGVTLSISGGIDANGQAGGNASGTGNASGGGGGAGGSILLKAQTATLGTNLVGAAGGAGGIKGTNGPHASASNGGAGGAGRVHIDYLTSYTGTTTPTLDALQDLSLGNTNGYSLFLSVSSNGTNIETYSKPVDIQSGIWQHVAVTWDASISTAELLLNAVSQGTVIGALTSINDNASTFNIAMDLDGTSTPQHLYDGLIDEVRIWNVTKTQEDFYNSLVQQINVASAGLQAYYQFNSVATDGTSNANNLTLTGSPAYSTDVPFSAATTRVDIDQSSATSGNTYALLTAVSELAANKKDFTPQKDPQKSLQVEIAALGAGTGTITVIVHDQYNNLIASKGVAKANLPASGNYEFIFDQVWRPLTNFTNAYHFHIIDSDGTATIVSGSANDLTTVDYVTYYQFLVEDTAFHPIAGMLQFLVFGNERYVGTLEASLYEPNAIALPAGFHVRCFGYWQEYLAIGVVKGNAVTDQDIGRIYFWDGIEDTYNFYIDVPQGGVNALLGAKGKLYVWAGYQGDLLVYEGGNSLTRLRQIPNLTVEKTAEIYPGAVTMWKSLIRFGVAGNSSSTDIYRGVYTYGSTNYKYPEILTYDYPISTGTTQSTGVRIGLCMTVTGGLIVGWGDGTGYGIDYIYDQNQAYATSGTIEFLVDDGGAIWKEKAAQTLVVKFQALEEGQTITPKVRLDDAGPWTYGETITSSSDDPTLARLVVTNERNYECQYGIDIVNGDGTSNLLIKGAGFESDNLDSERRV